MCPAAVIPLAYAAMARSDAAAWSDDSCGSVNSSSAVSWLAEAEAAVLLAAAEAEAAAADAGDKAGAAMSRLSLKCE